MTAVKLTNDKVADLKEAFMLLDYDKDGKIFSRDIGAVIRCIGLKPSEQEVRDIVNEINTRGDGMVDLQTLVALISKIVTEPEPQRAEDLREMFKLYDKEGKGSIPVQEMRHLLTTIGEKLTLDEADDLLKATGCVEKGAVNYDKFIRIVMGK